VTQHALGDSALVLAASMPRSASTWLYNVARFLISDLPGGEGNLSCGWVGDWQSLPRKPYMLLKIHDYQQQLVDSSRFVMYSFRDLRDVLASLKRKFAREPSLALADHLVAQHGKWMAVAGFVMRYESMLADREGEVLRLAGGLGMQDVDPAEIMRRVDALSYESQGSRNAVYHAENLYHRNHITDGRHGSWEGVLDADLVSAIEERHRSWFEENGYPCAR
jgi:hypothetical protein